MNETQQVLKLIEEERWRQDKKWGADHDDKHTMKEWCSILTSYIFRVDQPARGHSSRTNLIKVAAIAVAAIEADTRKLRERRESM